MLSEQKEWIIDVLGEDVRSQSIFSEISANLDSKIREYHKLEYENQVLKSFLTL